MPNNPPGTPPIDNHHVLSRFQLSLLLHLHFSSEPSVTFHIHQIPDHYFGRIAELYAFNLINIKFIEASKSVTISISNHGKACMQAFTASVKNPPPETEVPAELFSPATCNTIKTLWKEYLPVK
jgi:hypothetical protein